ncbi:hypothetical protein ElyMa_002946700 [Elysia marginata]|uniref:Uncharacterized protein n=1 Tax=Elysia marginata TaxID=1093978 RepID=A0AAV4I626_9GAST|nr:hypothetical protein ElyMa_002946700 [Elysia marginata]
MRFVHGNQYKDYYVPFRFMRRMAIGTRILNAYPRYEIPDSSLTTINFSPANATLMLLSDCPIWIKTLCFYQGEQDCIGFQPVFRFRNGSDLYYMPAMEFVRKLYIANAMCCDDVMYPARMETAVSYHEHKGNQLILHLLKRYRRAYITQGTAQFLARWHTCTAFRASFNSVAIETMLMPQSSYQPLQFDPPSIEQMQLTCLMESQTKRHWIQRIIDVRNIPLNAREIVIHQEGKRSLFKVR